MAPDDGSGIGPEPILKGLDGASSQGCKGFLGAKIRGFKGLAKKFRQVAHTVKGKCDDPG